MADFAVTIEILSPIHLGSGGANVNIDADIVRDELGLPYFPAKRFKGLLFESAVELEEMFEQSGIEFDRALVEDIFHHRSASTSQLIVPNFFLENHARLAREWKYLQSKYKRFFRPNDLLEAFSTVRYQTRLEEGVAARGSLRNLRVLNAGLKFVGSIELLDARDEKLQFLSLAIGNISAAGAKRNRGFGRIKCTTSIDARIDDFFDARGL